MMGCAGLQSQDMDGRHSSIACSVERRRGNFFEGWGGLELSFLCNKSFFLLLHQGEKTPPRKSLKLHEHIKKRVAECDAALTGHPLFASAMPS